MREKIVLKSLVVIPSHCKFLTDILIDQISIVNQRKIPKLISLSQHRDPISDHFFLNFFARVGRVVYISL